MIVRVNTDIVGEALSNKIESKLSKAKLPVCIGNMSPPIINAELPFEFQEILKNRQAVRPEEIAYNDISSLVTTNLAGGKKDLIIDNSGKLLIEERKESASTKYVDHIRQCALCENFELCNRLTTHYIETVKLSLLNRIAKALERRYMLDV